MSVASDRLPPQHIEAEMGVLGAILLDQAVLNEIVPTLRVDDFYRDDHREIYRGMLALYDRNEAIDGLTLGEELTRMGVFDRIGDEYLSSLLESVIHAANARYHASIVQRKAIKRELIEATLEVLKEAYDETFTTDDLLERAETRLFAIADSRRSGDVVGAESLMQETINRIEARSLEGVSGLETGFFEHDELVGGLPKALIIVAGRPSMGKTAFALNVVDHVAVRLNRPVMVVSLEMGREEVGERMLVSRARIDGRNLRRRAGNPSPDDIRRVGIASQELRAAPFVIDEGPLRTISQIAAMARRQKLRSGLALLVIDYLQLIEMEDTSRNNQAEQIAKVSRRCKMLAKELETPVMLLSQLNRLSEGRADKRPIMSDLRSSGSIEQDADHVYLIHRPEYYDPNDQPGVAECIVAKNRNGPTGVVRLAFLKHAAKFENLLNIAEPGVGAAY